ncbi:MAG TPA: hypothetical protein DCE76_04485 [Anaerolineaceae bacterium]|nr:hypothetical protein [Anaerolineaceae bacterium]
MINTKSIQFIQWSAYYLLVLGVIYIGLILGGIISRDPQTGFIRDGVRIFMEIVTILSAFGFLFFALSIKNLSTSVNNFLAEISVIFMTLLVSLTSIVHFVSITVTTQIVNHAALLSPVFSLSWPSLLLSIDILAWHIFFGLAFIFLGFSLTPIKELSQTRFIIVLSGIVALLGLIALPLNDMALRFIGIFGYTVMPIISIIFLLNKIDKIKNPSKQLTPC